MLRVSRIRLPDRKFTLDEVRKALRRADFGDVKFPGRNQVMDGHELRGLFHAYLFMVGGVLDSADGDVIEVPERARPFVDALRAAYVELAGQEGFVIDA